MKKEIKATDLRIGNYVESNIKDSYNGIAEWKQIKVVGVLDGSVHDEIDKVYFIEPQVSTFNLLSKYTKTGADCLRGVPLTEEWFLKFGFEHKEFSFDIYPFFLMKTVRNEFLYQAHTSRIRIEYVHQLQNLYFAVTGSELQITD